jgi:hypothetical protein
MPGSVPGRTCGRNYGCVFEGTCRRRRRTRRRLGSGLSEWLDIEVRLANRLVSEESLEASVDGLGVQVYPR